MKTRNAAPEAAPAADLHHAPETAPAAEPARVFAPGPLLLTDAEAAARLGIKPHTWRCWRCYGYLPDEVQPVRLGRLVRWRPADIERIASGELPIRTGPQVARNPRKSRDPAGSQG